MNSMGENVCNFVIFGVVFNVIEVIGSSTDTVYVVVFVTPFSV